MPIDFQEDTIDFTPDKIDFTPDDEPAAKPFRDANGFNATMPTASLTPVSRGDPMGQIQRPNFNDLINPVEEPQRMEVAGRAFDAARNPLPPPNQPDYTAPLFYEIPQLPSVPREEAGALEGIPNEFGNAAAGVLNAAAGIVNFLQSPEGIGILLTKRLPTGLRQPTFGAITADIVKNLPGEADALMNMIAVKDTKAAVEHAANLLMLPMFAKHTLKGAVEGGSPYRSPYGRAVEQEAISGGIPRRPTTGLEGEPLIQPPPIERPIAPVVEEVARAVPDEVTPWEYVSNAKNREEFLNGVITGAQKLKDGAKIAESDTGETWTVKKSSRSSGTEVIEFEAETPAASFSVEKKTGGGWTVSGEPAMAFSKTSKLIPNEIMPPVAPEAAKPTLAEDKAEFARLGQEMRKFIGDAENPALQDLLTQREVIKERHGGYQPGDQPSELQEAGTAVEPHKPDPSSVTLDPAPTPKPVKGGRVTLSGGDKFHGDISGIVADIKNDGRILEIIKDGDDFPTRVTVEDYKNLAVQEGGQIPIEAKASAVATPPSSPSPMSVEEANAHLNRPGQILGYDEQQLLDAQRKAGTLTPKPAPVEPVTPEKKAENAKVFSEAMSPQKSAELVNDLRKDGWTVSGVGARGKIFDHVEIFYRGMKVSEADTTTEGWRKIMDGEVKPGTDTKEALQERQEKLQNEFKGKYGPEWSGKDLSAEESARWKASAKPPVEPPKAEVKEEFVMPESVELNELRILREKKGTLGRLNAERLSELEAKESASEEPPPAEPKGPGMGAAIPEEFGQSGDYVSNMFAAIDRDRAAMGKPPMEATRPRTWDQDNATALAKMNKEPDWIPNLIAEVTNKPRPLLSWEQAGTVWQKAKWKAEANNAYTRINRAFEDGDVSAKEQAKAEAQTYENQLQALEDAVGRNGTGSEAGRSLQAQKMAAGDDFTLVEMRLQKRATANDGAPLNEKQAAEVAALHKEYQEKLTAYEKHIADQESRIAKSEVDRVLAEIKSQEAARPKYSPTVLAKAEQFAQYMDKRADDAMARIKAKLGRTNIGADPTILLDIADFGAAKITRGVVDFAKWSAEMVKDFTSLVDIKEDLAYLWKKANELSEAEANKKLGAAKEPVKRAVKDKADKAGQQQETIEKIKKRVSDKRPKEITIFVRQLERQFAESGILDREPLIDAVHGVLKDIVPGITRMETMHAMSGYGDYKQISKLEIDQKLRQNHGEMQQLGKLDDMARGFAPKRSGQERPIPENEWRRLVKQVEEAKRRGGYTVTDPATQLRTSLQATRTRLEHQITDLEHEIATKTKIVRQKSATPTSPEIEALKIKRDALKAKRMEIFGEEVSALQQQLKAFKTRTTNRIAELEGKLSNKDFTTKQRKPIPLDREATEMKRQLENVVTRWKEGLIADKMSKRKLPQKVFDASVNTLNLSRSLITSFDYSAVLRQGGFIGIANPARAVRNIPDMFRAGFSEKAAYRINQELKARPNYQRYKDSKLFLSEDSNSLSAMEEAYAGRWTKKVWGIHGSQRAYTTFLNKLRADSFDAMAKAYGDNLPPEAAKALANFINVSTGRGSFGAKENVANGLNTVFFSPRYLASRFQLLAGQPLWKGDVRTRTLIAKEYTKYLIGIGVVYSLGRFAGADIETDPKSADFLKLRWGNARIDPLSGLQQATVLLSRLWTGETTDLKGKTRPIAGKVPFGKGNRADVTMRFLRTKLAPIPGVVADVLNEKDLEQKPITVAGEVQKLTIPMNFGDIYQELMDEGIAPAAALGLLSIFGAGLQVYDEK